MPQLPIIGPWRERIRKEAAKEAATAVAKAFLTGNAATMPSNAAGMMQSASTGGPRMPGTSWSNQGGTSSALIARVTQNLSQSFGMAPAELEVALAEQGLSWGPPFPPGRPLDPFWGYRRAPRTWDYAVGENVQIVPRWDRVSFATMKAIYDAYDVAQICVVAGTEIVTRRGLLPVESVQVGDQVLTHKGRWRRVYRVMDNPVGDRQVVAVQAGGLDPLLATGDHPVLAARYCHTQSRQRVVERLDWVEAKDLRVRGRANPAPWRYDAAVLPALTFENARPTLDLAAVLGSNFQDDDGELVQTFSSVGRGATAVLRRTRMAACPATVKLDAALGRLLGWYLAEGSSSHGRSVTFTLAATETAEADQILADAREVFGVEGSVAPTSAGAAINVRIHHTALAQLLSSGTARTKQVPDWAWDAPREFHEAMLEAWVQGDGCVGHRNGWSPQVTAVTASRTLAWQMRMVAVALGHKASVTWHRPAQRLVEIRGGQVNSTGAYHVSWRLDPQRTGRYSFEEGGRLLTTAIQSVEPIHYHGRVYNLEVEGDHSYVTTGGVVHNCVRHLINDVRSLEYKFVAAPGVDQKAAELDIAKAEAFMALPDRRQPLRLWLAEWLQDVLRYDAGCLYVRRNEAGEPVALEVVDGTTMIPLIDFYGRIAADEHDATDQPEGGETGAVVPAFMQIIEGLPWDWLALDDIIYLPWNPLPNSQYGLSPLEAVLLSANTDLRFQWHFLQYFTEGTLPAGLMEAPPDQSDPDSLREWQETWDAIMLGDQSKLRQIRWVPSGSKFNATKNSDFDDKFPLYLMRRVAAAYGVTPNDLGFTENVNRATGDTQVDVQFRVGVIPLLRYAEDIINLFLREHLKLKAQIHFDDGREIEDRVATAQAHQIYVQAGVESPDEVRSELGLPIDPANPTPRFLAGRTGVVLLSTLEEQAGKTSPETFAPPKPPPPKLMPPPGALTPNDGPPAPGGPPAPPPGQPPKPQGQPEQGSADDADEKTMKALFERIDGLLGELQKDNSGGPGVAGGLGSTGGPLHIGAPDNTGGPGVTRGLANPTTITGGLMVDTDLQGVDLIGAEEDEDEEDDDKDDAAKQALLALTLKRWRENSRRRLNKGLPPRRFADVPEDVASVVWGRLANARSHAEIDEAFKAASGGGGSAPKGRGLTATSKRSW